MKTILAMIIAAAMSAAGAEYVSSSASGSTSAGVSWPARPGKQLRLTSVDVTSDKAASYITWRNATGLSATTAAVAADDTTNLTTWSTGLASNDVVLLQNASGSVVERTVWGRTSLTNQVINFTRVLATNLASGDALYELTNSATTIYAGAELETNETAIHVTATNGFAPDDMIIVRKVSGGATEILTVTDVAETNLTVDAREGLALEGGDYVTRLTSLGTLVLPAGAAEFSVTATRATTNFLTRGDSVILVPVSGGIFTNVFLSTEGKVMDTVILTAETGIAMSIGDGVYGTTTNGTPCGAATVRLNGQAIFAAPPGRPGLLKVDGTSACKVNCAVAVYE